MPFSDEIKIEEPKIVEVSVVKKGKRILVFLADFFINFIVSFFIFNLAVIPIGKVATGYEEKNSQYILSQKESMNVLYKNGILFSKHLGYSDEYYILSDSLSYTFDRFLSYYVLDEGENPDSSDPNIKKDINNEVSFVFFNNIRNNKEQYLNLFSKYNETDSYFSLNNNMFVLSSTVKKELYSYFDSKQGHALTDNGKAYYKAIQENLFLKLYSDIMNDIKTNDLSYVDNTGQLLSYKNCQEKISEIESYHINLLTYSAIITYVFVWLVYYVAVPMFIQNYKTLGMLILKVDRVNPASVSTLSRKMTIFVSIYYLFSNLMFIMFLPMFLISFNYLFNLTILFSLSMISALYLLGSLIFLLFSSYNQTLSDKLTKSAIVKSNELDEAYRSRGYLSEPRND